MLLKKNIGYIKYTLAHRKAFRKIEKELTGKISIRGWLHDIDKIFLYAVFEKPKAHDIHRNWSRHHSIKAHTNRDFVQMVIDWECARYTKPDKPLNARDTLYKFYTQLEKEILPILDKFNL